MGLVMRETMEWTFVDLIRQKAQKTPQLRVFTFLDGDGRVTGSISYADLDESARAIAQQLIELGMAGQSVLLAFQPGLDFIKGFLGCLYAGVRAVPIHTPTRRQIHRMESIVKDAEAKLILTSSDFEGLMTMWWQNTELDTDKRLKLVSVDKINLAKAGLWKRPNIKTDDTAFLQYTSGSTGQPKGVIVSHANILHNLSLIVNENKVNDHSVTVTWLPQFHDMGLIAGLLAPLYAGCPTYMMSPGTFSKNPLSWLKAIHKYRATHSGGPCFAYEHCLKSISEDEKDALDLSSWQIAYCGAEPVRKVVMDAFSAAFKRCGFVGAHISPVYGMAEATLLISSSTQRPKSLPVEIEALQQNRIESGGANFISIMSCGAVVNLPEQDEAALSKAIIVEPESMRPVEFAGVGEIWIKGPSVCKGYWNKPELTQHTFNAQLNLQGDSTMDKGPYLRTGDLGFMHEGEVYVTGRLKNIIILRGANYYPQDIEAAAYADDELLVPNSSAAFCTNLADDQIVLVQEVAPRVHGEDIAELEKRIRLRVAKDMGLHLHDLVLIKFGAINKTSSGKIQHQKIRERYLCGDLTRLNHVLISPASDVSTIAIPMQIVESKCTHGLTPSIVPSLAQSITAEVNLRRKLRNTLKFWIADRCDLDILDIKDNDNFMALGLDSLSIAEMLVNIEKVFNIKIPEYALYQCQSIEELTEYVDTMRNHKPASIKWPQRHDQDVLDKKSKIVLPKFQPIQGVMPDV
jgi:acyl carrier protein